MGKRHTIFISTNPQNLAPIGTPGQGLFIGSPGQFIFGQSEQIVGDGLITESSLSNIEIESSTNTLIVEGG